MTEVLAISLTCSVNWTVRGAGSAPSIPLPSPHAGHLPVAAAGLIRRPLGFWLFSSPIRAQGRCSGPPPAAATGSAAASPRCVGSQLRYPARRIGCHTHRDGAQRAPAQRIRGGHQAPRPRPLGRRRGPDRPPHRLRPAQRLLRGTEARRLQLRAATHHELPLLPGIHWTASPTGSTACASNASTRD
jgi:hypothetical protein